MANGTHNLWTELSCGGLEFYRLGRFALFRIPCFRAWTHLRVHGDGTAQERWGASFHDENNPSILGLPRDLDVDVWYILTHGMARYHDNDESEFVILDYGDFRRSALELLFNMASGHER